MRMYIGSAYLSLFIILYLLKLQANTAYVPEGYIGCFEDYRRYRVLKKGRKFYPNSGKICKSFCRAQGYRYAGTESGEECFCGNNIRIKRPANDCDYECQDNPSEYCGGAWRISIYDTWHCVTSPCLNGATCTDIDANNYSCTCTDEWTGIDCKYKKAQTTVQSTSTTTETTTKTTTSTAVITKTSSPSAKSTERTSRESRANVTDIPYIKPTGSNTVSFSVTILLFCTLILI